MSKGTPAEPSSETMRPQYGSSPKSEHWTSMESATLRAAACAASSLGAPRTCTWATLVAPSASSTICSASDRQASVSAAVSAVGAGLDPSPLASTSTVSLVEVHPSTVMVLNEAATASRSAWCRVGGVDGGVRRAHGEHGGHVGREHGGALGHAADGEAVAEHDAPPWARCRWS